MTHPDQSPPAPPVVAPEIRQVPAVQPVVETPAPPAGATPPENGTPPAVAPEERPEPIPVVETRPPGVPSTVPVAQRSSRQLPFTGLPLGGLLALGAALVVTGVIVRRASPRVR